MGEEILRRRRDRIGELREAGVNPFPYSFARTHTISDVLARFDELAESGETVRVAGRVMLHRATGKLTFFHVEDMGARMQFSGRFNELGADAYGAVKALDIGDLIGVAGTVWTILAFVALVGIAVAAFIAASSNSDGTPEPTTTPSVVPTTPSTTAPGATTAPEVPAEPTVVPTTPEPTEEPEPEPTEEPEPEPTATPTPAPTAPEPTPEPTQPPGQLVPIPLPDAQTNDDESADSGQDEPTAAPS